MTESIDLKKVIAWLSSLRGHTAANPAGSWDLLSLRRPRLKIFTVEVIDIDDKAAQERVRKSQARWVPKLRTSKGGEITLHEFEILKYRDYSLRS
ncbi:MAG: hypothetical protein NTY03_01605 [Candidatus Bathyarchaeota archaeon]|nr:hypothetical protein [Candidatus Bathyarchaeota archaeon]